jgi:hypothetical protein
LHFRVFNLDFFHISFIFFYFVFPFGQDVVGFSFLAKHLRTSKNGGTYVQGNTFQQEAEAYDTALSAVSTDAKLGFSGGSYVRAHLLRKHLIRVDYQSDNLRNQAKGLSHKQLMDLKLPDEMGYLETVHYSIRHRYTFGQTFNCYPLFISCFACLARAPLQQHPQALAYAESPENKETIVEALDRYRTAHGYNPSPERLFQMLLEKSQDRPRSIESTRSSPPADKASELPESGREGQNQTNNTAKSNKSFPQKTVSKEVGQTRGRGRPPGSYKVLRHSEFAAAGTPLGTSPPRKASLSSSSSRHVATTGTDRPVFRHLLTNREPMALDLDLEEEGEDAD